MSNCREIELMSPVGSYESLMAALQAKTNAIYFGVEQLNMRSRSSANFKLEDVEKITNLCQKNKVRSYLTLNTVIYNNEIELVKSIIDKAKTCGISAIIASDISVITYARSIDMEIHISTQCNITNIEAVKFYAAYSDVMVTARELSLEQVAEIVNQIKLQKITGPSGNLVKIEIFAHGALCMAVSGKCYLSLDNLNYSANRGACMQICRRAYVVTDKDSGIELEVDNEYIMSPKDLSTIGFLDKIIEAGISVLKIEGRGRSPEYVKTVTSCYREAIDAYYEGNYNQKAIDNWNNRLKTVYNRGFWDGYYLGKKLGEWTEQYGSQATKKKVYIGKITNYFSKLKVAEVKIETYSLKLGDEVIIIGPTTGVVEETIKEIRVDLKNVEQTVKGETCSIALKELVRRGDQLYKITS